MHRREEILHLKAFSQGSIESFRWLYDRYFTRVYNYCHSLMRVREEVEEITSEVFVTLWRKRSAVQLNQGSIQPLLFKITKDLAWNHLKKTAASKRGQQRYLDAYPQSYVVNGEITVLYREQQRKLRTMLKELTPQQERVFKMRFFQGYDLSAIAEELKISKNTVKVHLVNSKQFITSSLTEVLLWVTIFSQLVA